MGLSTSFILFYGLATVAKFRFWGPHLAVLFPFFVLGAIQFSSGADRGGRWRFVERALTVLIAITWLLSDARLLFLPQYHKDDYRDAAQVALHEAGSLGGQIVWAADALAGRYYGVELTEPAFVSGQNPRPALLGQRVNWRVLGKGIFGANWTKKDLDRYIETTAQNAPIVLVLSKPDLYDRWNTWRGAVVAIGARRIASPNAFEIYVLNGQAVVGESWGPR